MLKTPSGSNGASTCINNVKRLEAQDVITLFNQEFGQSHLTHLVGGQSEPLYRARVHEVGRVDERDKSIIFFTHDYVSSALHEVAHWCVAGRERRTKDDYGYWYLPDGRDANQQIAFERVEAKPQALEWIFSKAAGVKFSVSADNLALGKGPNYEFKQAIFMQVKAYLEQGLPARANRFIEVLHRHTKSSPLEVSSFSCDELE